jgi:hypothetical protein
LARAKLCTAKSVCSIELAALLCAASPLACTELSSPVQGPGARGGAPQCPAGQIGDAEGCIPVGIQGCNGLFVGGGDDGLCRPGMDRCAPGTIPRLGDGCVEVGISGCAKVFVGDDGLCRPTMARCPPGTLAIPQEACVPLDGPDGCGEEPWGNIVEMPGDVYVDPESIGGPNAGSRDRPLTDIASALAAVQDGGRVVLAKGDYEEAVEITKAVELVGRCASLVTLRGEQLDPNGNVSAVSIHDVVGAGVRGVHVVSRSIGVFVQGAEAALSNVHVSGDDGIGVAVSRPGTSLVMSHSLIESTSPAQGGTSVRTNVLIVAGARAELTGNVLLDGNTNLRVNSEAQQITLLDNLIEDIALQPDESDGFGAIVDAGTLRLGATAVVNNRLGVLVTGPGAELVMTGSFVVAPPGGTPAAGDVIADLGARATVESSVLSGACDAQLTVSGAGTKVTATGNLFQGTADEEEGGIGRGVELRNGALTLTSNAIFQARDVGLLASGGNLTATGNLVEGTRASPLYPALSAGVLLTGAQAVVTSSYVSSNRLFGIVQGAGASLELAESLIEGTAPGAADGNAGIGLLASGAASTSVRGSAVLKSHAVGVLLVSSPAKIDGTLIRGVESGTFSSGPASAVSGLGDGLLALGSTAELSASCTDRCARAGLLFDDSAGSVAGSSATQNRFGLVVQGGRAPEVARDNTFDANTEQDEVTDGALPVPRDASLDR